MTCQREHYSSTLICWVKDEEDLVFVHYPRSQKEGRSDGKNDWGYAGVNKADDHHQKKIWVLPAIPDLRNSEKGVRIVRSNANTSHCLICSPVNVDEGSALHLSQPGSSISREKTI